LGAFRALVPGHPGLESGDARIEVSMNGEHKKCGGRILRLPDVKELVGLSRSAIYRRIAQGDFPQAISLGGHKAVGWHEASIEQWIASRPAARGGQQ
jgi:prophage regulatory protein